MKVCSEIKDCISAYIDDELDQKSRIEFEEHVVSCQECKDELDGIMQIVNMCRELEEEELPVNFKEELHCRLMEAIVPDKYNGKVLIFRNKYFRMFSSVAAVFLLVFLIKGLLYFGHFGKTTSSNEAFQMSMADIRDGKESPNMKSAVAPEAANDGSLARSGGAVEDSTATYGTGGVHAETGVSATGRSDKDNRANQYTMAADAGGMSGQNDNVQKNQAGLAILVDDPSNGIESVRAIALKYNGIEQAAPVVDLTFSMKTQETFTGSQKATDEAQGSSNETQAAVVVVGKANDMVELYYKIPNDQYQAFIDELKTQFGKDNITTEPVSSEDMSARLQELLKQSDALDLKISELDKKNDTASKDEVEKLRTDKLALQDEIDSVRLGTDLILVRIVIRKP